MDVVLTILIGGAVGFAVAIVVGAILSRGTAETAPEDAASRIAWYEKALNTCILLVDPKILPRAGSVQFPDDKGPEELANLMNQYFKTWGIKLRATPLNVRITYAELESQSMANNIQKMFTGRVAQRPTRPTRVVESEE